ncbi:transglycosylase domain-containing protein [Paenibacillus rhizoplanae]
MYLNRGQNLLRKLNEASIALTLEKQLSKDEILQLYLNQIYMGQGQYGVKSAAERYFWYN